MSEGSPFSRRAVALLIGAGVVLAIAVLLLTGFGNEINRATASGGPPPDNRSATGFYALRKIIARSGAPEPGIGDRNDDRLSPGLLILTPKADTRPEDVLAIVKARHEAAEVTPRAYPEDDEADEAQAPALHRVTLIVLPKWQVAPIPLRAGAVQRVGLLDTDKLAKLVPFVKATLYTGLPDRPGVDRRRGLLPFLVPDIHQSVKADGIETLIGTRDGAAVLGRISGRDIYVLADPDLLDNYAMRDIRNARAAIAMLAAINPDSPDDVNFDVSLFYGQGDRNLMKLMFAPPFLAVTIALMAAAVLAGIATANRFGPPRREARAIAFGKAALIDNVAALTRLAGRSADGGARYALASREWIARRLGLARSLSGAALDTHLDKLSAPGAPGIETLTERLESARGEDELVRAARALHDWRKDLSA